ncbi:MAG TPA: hypothetical protein VKP66_18280 [Steroidobacteraceae bacterium]|nr:hypothetical protein [Steroidobacteraceae bacterium]
MNMKKGKSGRILVAMLFSTATLGVTSSAALADDVATIYGRSSESGAMAASLKAAVPEDVSNVYGRAPEAELTADEARYHLTFTLTQGVHQDNLPTVDAWPGRAAAPLDENATWKITTQSVDKSEGPHG